MLGYSCLQILNQAAKRPVIRKRPSGIQTKLIYLFAYMHLKYCTYLQCGTH